MKRPKEITGANVTQVLMGDASSLQAILAARTLERYHAVSVLTFTRVPTGKFCT